MLFAGASIAGLTAFSTSCSHADHAKVDSNGEIPTDSELISPNEDLMREHGLLQRMLLIYDFCIHLLEDNKYFMPEFLHQTATIIRDFIEDYHEKLEEEFVFTRMKKAGVESHLVDVLIQQHNAGRTITDIILRLSRFKELPQGDSLVNMLGSLRAFVDMYRHHEAWEETVLFPAFKKVVSANEYAALGEEFEEKEHQKFGQDGFETMVDKVAGIEKQMGIYDLSLFTPVI
jgi:hemerythrin-like domain-containing protein